MFMYRSNRSFNIPPGAYPGRLTPLPSRRGVNFDFQGLPGGGEFDPHALGVGSLNSCETSGVASNHGGRGVGGFSWKRLCLCGQLVTRKGLKQALCRIEGI